MSNTNKMDHLYDQVTAFIEQSLGAVLQKSSSATGYADLESAVASSRTLLEKFRDKTNDDIRELRELSEWETFTIAFYGETNAGKSTLIETLRILLGDSEKLATQQQFQALAKELHIDAESIAALEKSVQQLQGQLTESQRNADSLAKQLLNEEIQQHARLTALIATIANKRKNLSIWQKLVYLFKKLDEEKALLAQEQALAQLKE